VVATGAANMTCISDSPPSNYRLMTVTNRLTADCWLWLTKRVNTFCRFSWSLKANLEMAREYCHLPDNCADPIHTAPSSCLICHWHWCIVIFPCCSLLFHSCGNVLRKVWNVSDCVQRQRFLEFYKLFHVFFEILTKNCSKKPVMY